MEDYKLKVQYISKKRIPVKFFAFLIAVLLFFVKNGSAQTTEEKYREFYYYDSIGCTFLESNSDSALKYTMMVLSMVKNIDDDHLKISAYTLAGNTYSKLYEFNNSLSYFVQVLKLLNKNGINKEAAILGNIGNVYVRQERYEEACRYFKKQYESALREKNYELQIAGLTNICEYFNQFDMPDSSIAKLKMALSIARHHDKPSISGVFDNMANAYYHKAELLNKIAYYKPVLAYADSALQLHLIEKDSLSIAYVYGLLGATYMNLKKYAASEKYYVLFQELNKRLNDIFGLKMGYEEMGTMYARQGLFEKAYACRLRYDSINKLYLNELATKQVQELDKKYQTEKKDQENQLLSARNNLSEEVIKRQKSTVILVVAGLVALLIALLFIFKNLRTQKKANSIIQKQKREVEIQKSIVEEKNKEITDSIQYAKRIQTALLPSEKFIGKELKKSRS